jgi:hypothetical protein
MFVVLSVPAEEADKVSGNSSCEETMALTENCRCIVVRSTCAQLDLRGRGCVGGGRAALRVDRSAHATNVDWSVCKRYTIFCAVQSS